MSRGMPAVPAKCWLAATAVGTFNAKRHHAAGAVLGHHVGLQRAGVSELARLPTHSRRWCDAARGHRLAVAPGRRVGSDRLASSLMFGVAGRAATPTQCSFSARPWPRRRRGHVPPGSTTPADAPTTCNAGSLLPQHWPTHALMYAVMGRRQRLAGSSFRPRLLACFS
jgi:hypothetical protein